MLEKKSWALMLEKTSCNTIFASFSLSESANRIRKAIGGAFFVSFERATVNALCSNVLAQRMAQVCKNKDT